MEQQHRSSMSIERAGNKVIVSVRGVLDAQATPLFGHFLEDLIDGQGNLDVVIDLRDVASVDPDTVDVLVHAAGRMKSRGGSLVLTAPKQVVRDSATHARPSDHA